MKIIMNKIVLVLLVFNIMLPFVVSRKIRRIKNYFNKADLLTILITLTKGSIFGEIKYHTDLKFWNLEGDLKVMENALEETIKSDFSNIFFWTGFDSKYFEFFLDTIKMEGVTLAFLLKKMKWVNSKMKFDKINYPNFWTITSFLYASSIAKLYSDNFLNNSKFYLFVGNGFTIGSSALRFEIGTLRTLNINFKVTIKCEKLDILEIEIDLNEVNEDFLINYCKITIK